MRAWVAGLGLSPIWLIACARAPEHVLWTALSPDGRAIAVETYVGAGPLASDDTRVQVYKVEKQNRVQPCWAFRGAYGKIDQLRWLGTKRLEIAYESPVLAEIHTRCGFEDAAGYREVEILPRPIPVNP